MRLVIRQKSRRNPLLSVLSRPARRGPQLPGLIERYTDGIKGTEKLKAESALKEFSNVKIEGFEFCRKANEYFESLKNQPGGINRVRLRRERPIKKFIEEVVPLANYIRRSYLLGLILKVKWIDGDQNYDAIIYASGTRVDREKYPKKRFVEITTAIHPKEYLVREHLAKNGFAGSAKGMSRDAKTGETVSKPVVNTDNQQIGELVDQIIGVVKNKASKKYPNGTDLVIQCKADTLIYDYEWDEAVKRVLKNVPEINLVK